MWFKIVIVYRRNDEYKDDFFIFYLFIFIFGELNKKNNIKPLRNIYIDVKKEKF